MCGGGGVTARVGNHTETTRKTDLGVVEVRCQPDLERRSPLASSLGRRYSSFGSSIDCSRSANLGGQCGVEGRDGGAGCGDHFPQPTEEKACWRWWGFTMFLKRGKWGTARRVGGGLGRQAATLKLPAQARWLQHSHITVTDSHSTAMPVATGRSRTRTNVHPEAEALEALASAQHDVLGTCADHATTLASRLGRGCDRNHLERNGTKSIV